MENFIFILTTALIFSSTACCAEDSVLRKKNSVATSKGFLPALVVFLISDPAQNGPEHLLH